MKKTTGGLCLLMTLAIASLTAPLYANESVAPKRTVIASRYDVSKEVTLEGTVQSLVRKPAPGTMMGAHLIVSTAEGSTDPRVKQAFFIVEPNQKQLVEIGDLLDAGRLRTVVDAVVPLSQAPEVYAGTVPRQHHGKIVVSVATIQ